MNENIATSSVPIGELIVSVNEKGDKNILRF